MEKRTFNLAIPELLLGFFVFLSGFFFSFWEKGVVLQRECYIWPEAVQAWKSTDKISRKNGSKL